jgi:hypothetical protein
VRRRAPHVAPTTAFAERLGTHEHVEAIVVHGCGHKPKALGVIVTLGVSLVAHAHSVDVLGHAILIQTFI